MKHYLHVNTYSYSLLLLPAPPVKLTPAYLNYDDSFQHVSYSFYLVIFYTLHITHE